MPGSTPGLMWIKDRYGSMFELINQARTAAYLQNPNIGFDGIMPCDVTDYGGCETYTLFPECGEAPSYVGVGSITNGTGDVVGDLPAGLAVGDALLMMIETSAQEPSISNPAGGTWASLGSVASGTPGGADSTMLALYWSRYNGTQTDPTVGDPGDHALVAILAFRNANSRDTPFRVLHNSTYGGVSAVNYGQLEVPRQNSIMVALISDDWDNPSTTRYVTWDYGTASMTEVIDTGTTDGLGGGFGAAYLELTDAGITPPIVVDIDNTAPTAATVARALVVEPEQWVTLDFDTPATDPAPWYSADYPESADALGFYIVEWTGLDDRHVTRSVTQYGTARGGATLGPLGNKERVQRLNIHILARTEAASEYLFRWLASALESVCGACDADSLVTRLHCTDVEDPAAGLVEMRNVGLIEGLGWEADLFSTPTCVLRLASFTLAAGDPCMYLSADSVLSTVAADDLADSLDANEFLDLDRSPCRPSCSELDSDSRASYSFTTGDAMGARAPVITFDNPSTDYRFPFRAILYHDPNSIGVTPNPCALPILAEIYVRPLPPSSTLQWDIAGREIYFRDPTTGVFVSGWPFVDANDASIPRFAVLPCGDHHLVLEPATLCVESLGGGAYSYQGLTFDPAAFPGVSIAVQERVSCR